MHKKIPLLVFSVSLLLFAVMISPAYAGIVPPKKQTSFGISLEDIVCQSGMFKVIKESTNSPACVKTSSVSKLVSKGWAKPVDETDLQELITQTSGPVGTIKKIIVTPINTSFGKLTPKFSVASYDYVFEVCANSQSLVSPSVLIRSDSETKQYELVETVNSGSCVISATIIKASNPDSISASLLSAGDISNLIMSINERIDTLKKQLLDAKQSIGQEVPEAEKQKGNKISDLRFQLNDAIADLHRTYFLLYSPSKTKFTSEKMSFSGTPIQGETATKISVSKSIATANTYDVVFEACAGEKQVRLPVIIVSSDNQTVNVKLSDKIAPKTCQLTSAKVTATNPESISVKVAGNADSSNKTLDLEATINNLQIQLISEKDILKTLVHDPKRPADFNEQLTSQVEKISKLRDDIISAKAELNKILYLTYK